MRAEFGASSQRAATVEVAKGLHVRLGLVEDSTAANHDAIANLGFIVGCDAVAMIDPGGSLYDGLSLRLAIRAIKPLPIRYVVLSHVHPDDIFGRCLQAGRRDVRWARQTPGTIVVPRRIL